MIQLPRSIALLALLAWAPSVWSQVMLDTDEGVRQRLKVRSAELALRSGLPDTLQIGPSSPFFDDFSTVGDFALPDTQVWFIPDEDFRAPMVVRNAAKAAPTPGVVRLDGLRRSGIPYETLLALRGKADRLVSHLLDFQGQGPASNLWFYAYVEAGGLGELPESNDSLAFSLVLPNDTFRLATLGGTQANGGGWIAIPLDQAPYFGGLAQLVIENDGSLNGLLDVWLVDYVYIGTEWPGGVANLDEQGPERLLSSPLEPYFQLPFRLYELVPGWQTGYEVRVRQNAAVPFSGTLHGEWTGPNNGLSSPFFDDVAVNVPASGSQTASLGPYAWQATAEQGTWRATHYLTGNNDARALNDTLHTDIRLDSLWGYDDGIADRTFGLNKSTGFGLRFDLPQPDTATAVWIQFVPTVNVNGVNGKITYLDGKVFRLRIWNQAHPDSFIVEQVAGSNVAYGGFVRFPLQKPLVLPPTCWVGLQQMDEIPIGIGYDQSFDRDAWTYWDSAGQWIQTRLDGVPMVRLELQGSPSKVVLATPDPLLQDKPRLLTNPVAAGSHATILMPSSCRQYRATLFHLDGREVYRWENETAGAERLLPMPAGLSPGLFFLKHEWEINGETRNITERLLLTP